MPISDSSVRLIASSIIVLASAFTFGNSENFYRICLGSFEAGAGLSVFLSEVANQQNREKEKNNQTNSNQN